MVKQVQESYHFDELMNLDQSIRINLINSLVGFRSVCLIGTINQKNISNLAIFNSIVHIGASPPLIGFVVRPDCVDRHTLSNILERKYYTINHINDDIFKQAHQTAARYPEGVSEFEKTNLKEEYKTNFIAPFVSESRIQLGVEFKERINIAINNTILVVGEIKQVHFPADCLCDDGFIDLEKAKSITCSGLDRYHNTKHIARLSYANTEVEAKEVALSYVNKKTGS